MLHVCAQSSLDTRTSEVLHPSTESQLAAFCPYSAGDAASLLDDQLLVSNVTPNTGKRPEPGTGQNVIVDSREFLPRQTISCSVQGPSFN